MKIKIRAGVLIPCLFAATASFADVNFIAEPYLGYSGLGGLIVNSSASSTDLGSLSGLVLGGRAWVGFAKIFFAGLDFSYFPSMNNRAPSGTVYSIGSLTSVNSVKLGLLGGVELPLIPLRFWLGYNFFDSLTATDGQGILATRNTPFTLRGGSIKAGVGYKILPILAVNLEFLASAYTSLMAGGQTTSYSSGSNVASTTLILSVSAPLTFY